MSRKTIHVVIDEKTMTRIDSLRTGDESNNSVIFRHLRDKQDNKESRSEDDND